MNAMFRLDDRLAVVLTQSSCPVLTVEIDPAGYELTGTGSALDDTVFEGNSVTLPCDSLAVLLFRKS